jgi:hypothetical protein
MAESDRCLDYIMTFNNILIANRGDRRAHARAAAISDPHRRRYSDDDANSLHVKMTDDLTARHHGAGGLSWILRASSPRPSGTL